ncbi:hypothetical protein Agub_g8599 [Astrephomene gubernaculifera]|uniref:3-methyl-2-oxobutanoate hydroxymethyltransferase n=1 Tax=Astrephomene gubernaculifera TaxID=47775 RepID=A0AAD3DRX6_9CHLO|nr:hypothetical protein Agub_g8599 [Astrephomene gubernaculifera]
MSAGPKLRELCAKVAAQSSLSAAHVACAQTATPSSAALSMTPLSAITRLSLSRRVPGGVNAWRLLHACSGSFDGAQPSPQLSPASSAPSDTATVAAAAASHSNSTSNISISAASNTQSNGLPATPTHLPNPTSQQQQQLLHHHRWKAPTLPSQHSYHPQPHHPQHPHHHQHPHPQHQHQAPLLSQPFRRPLSVQPEAAVYAGPSPRTARVTLRTIRKKYDAGEPLTMVTAYDYPSAVHVDTAGIDILLVGDSAAMVVHGHDTTLPISLDDMTSHCRAVARGARRAFLVGDLPFGCYETDPRDAVKSAVRMLKEGGMDAVKLEGGSPARVEAARAIVETGVAVMGHVGLTPQSVSAIGGFRPQAQVAEEALRVLDQAQALQRAGCFALVLECVPGPIAAGITRVLSIPTIGIGAGGECSGQVLVYHDLLGMMSHPHHAKVTPKFCKQYARVGDIIGSALQRYRQEVEERVFPGPQYSPYRMPEQEVRSLAEALRGRGLGAAAEAVLEEAEKLAAARREAAAAKEAAAAAAAAAGGSGSGGGSGGAAGGAGRGGA